MLRKYKSGFLLVHNFVFMHENENTNNKKNSKGKSQLFWKLKIIKIAGEFKELEQNEVINVVG